MAEARAQLLALVTPLEAEVVPLRAAAGRALAETLVARHDQPPFSASAMDGFVVARTDVSAGDSFRVIGESAAGHPFEGPVGPGEAVRIFTGAPIPTGGQRVVIQEDVARDGDRISVKDALETGHHIRPAAGDFAADDRFFADHRLAPRDIALLAAMGHATLPVRRKPVVAILMTGDELRLPGEALGPGQITASNGFGLAAMIEGAGGTARLLPIARDTPASLRSALSLARDADLLITIGGASVGDHDLGAEALIDAGTRMAFHRVAMRPGKPLMAGRIGRTTVVGLPGNPVSAMVCATIFILPLLARYLDLKQPDPEYTLELGTPLTANGHRQHYMRATLGPDKRVHVAERQDSSLLSVLATSDLLVVRPPDDGPKAIGDTVRVLPLT
ncbi:MAG: molybdopterin molybdotransferase MoeA [Jannaschia sp.]